jgi:hypothetical protein
VLSKNVKIRIYKTMILPVVLYGYERDDVTGNWRKLHNREFHNLYSSPNIIRMIKSWRMIWEGHVARMREKNEYRILMGKPEGKSH